MFVSLVTVTLLVLLMVGLSFYTYLHYYLFRGIKEASYFFLSGIITWHTSRFSIFYM